MLLAGLQVIPILGRHRAEMQSSATGLTAGNYTVSVTDSKGCLSNTVLTISQNTVAPNVTATVGGSLNRTTTSVILIEGSTTPGDLHLAANEFKYKYC